VLYWLPGHVAETLALEPGTVAADGQLDRRSGSQLLPGTKQPSDLFLLPSLHAHHRPSR
jgi:hypothetical protein